MNTCGIQKYTSYNKCLIYKLYIVYDIAIYIRSTTKILNNYYHKIFTNNNQNDNWNIITK